MKPVDKPVYVEFGTSDTAFNIQLEGAGEQADLRSEQYLKDNLVQARRQQITYRWIGTGRWYNWWDGYYLPNEQIVVVDRQPETREWTADPDSGTSTKDEAIWVESRDSVGFSTGISITARIGEPEGTDASAVTDDAIKFLFNYPAKPDAERQIDCTAISGKDDYQVKTSGLAKIMDTEVRTKVQSVFADEAAKYIMDDLRFKKNEILAVLRGERFPVEVTEKANEDGDVELVYTYPEAAPESYLSVVDFFEKRGVTITAIGMFGGYTYENTDIQTAIDKVFQEQQDKNVAIAEREAAEERKDALRLKGEGKAAEVETAAEGEAKAIERIADAKAYELEQLQSNPEAYMALKKIELETERLKVWDGRYPTYYIGSPLDGLGGENMNMFLPAPSEVTVAPAKPRSKPVETAAGE